MNRQDRAAVVLCLCAAVALGFIDHRARSDRYRQHVVTEYVPSVIAGSSGAPAKYRVMMPFTLDALERKTHADPYLIFLVVELVAIAASLVLLYVYLRHWYDPAASLGGTFAFAALLPLTFTNSWAHPDTFPDLALFTAGCLAIARRRDLALAIILAIGMLNRETMGFLLLLWAADRLPSDRRGATVLRFAALAATSILVYAGVRWIRGYEQYRVFMLPENLQMLRILPAGFDPYTRVAGYFWVVLVAAPGYLAVSGARQPSAPHLFRAVLPVAALYVLVVWLFAAIIEVRVLVPVLVLLLAPAVHAFAQIKRASVA